MTRKLAYALPATLSLGLIACGGGPDIDRVKADFQNPTGSVQSKDGMVAASGQLDASGGAVVVAGGGVPGVSLTATGKPVGLYQLNLRRNWETRAQSVADFLDGRMTATQALSEAQFAGEGCDSSPEAQKAFEEATVDILTDSVNPFSSRNKLTGKASYTQDLSACSNGELSGSIKVDIEILLEQQGDNARFAFTVEYQLNNVCELNTDARTCLDGGAIMQAEGSSQNDFGRLEFTSAWKMDGTWNEGTVAREASIKGGMRFLASGDGDSGSAKVEILSYVNAPEGEWSYVWTFEGAFNGLEGSASVECRGRDGSVSCTVDENGGMCSDSNGNSISWTSADEQALDDSWFD